MTLTLDQAKNVANEFAKLYYHTFDTDRSGLANLYHPEVSILKFEKPDVVVGREAIVKKLVCIYYYFCHIIVILHITLYDQKLNYT